MAKNVKDVENFRDQISTVDDKGKRVWIYPKKPKGRFHRYRVAVAIFLLAILFTGPFIKIAGQPLLLINVMERKFVIFGMAFWPQDFHLFFLATLALIVFIILFTVVFGRLFCGWACPQTIFMEMVFRKIEYWIEGDAHRQRVLKKAPWTFDKILKKTSKHIIFYSISFLIGNTFLAYIIGIEELKKVASASPSEHMAGFVAMILFSGAFYFVFAFFREQVCTLVCPYGRLQGVLLDQDSIVVAYDFNRGEPRAKISRNKEDNADAGDCIMCYQCVEVCPTGIDIRNGTQLECVNCTACIDACDEIMVKVNRPKGLIRYASYNSIVKGLKFKLSPRIIGYSSILVILMVVLATMLMTRSDIETTILRTPGILYQETEQGTITNLYNIIIINKTFEKMPIKLNLERPAGKIKMVGGDINIPESEIAETSFFVELERKTLFTTSIPIQIGVYSNEQLLEEVNTNFMGPQKTGKPQ
jgi:cytochrome c oxidase accessory protein FixG